MDGMIPHAGPSRHQNSKDRRKKEPRTLSRPAKVKKLTEKQKIEALDKEASNFVS